MEKLTKDKKFRRLLLTLIIDEIEPRSMGDLDWLLDTIKLKVDKIASKHPPIVMAPYFAKELIKHLKKEEKWRR